MTRTRIHALVFTLALAVACLAPAAGSPADGLPVGGGDTTAQGVMAPDGSSRYLAFTGPETTVAEIATRSGEALDWLRVPGRFTVPSVTLEGATEGLSGDGRALVLIKPRMRFPRRRTALAVIDPLRMRLVERIRLNGDFSYDALSADGRSLYLIEYVDRRDFLRYDVRVYDLRQGRLDPQPIVDPREPDEEMGGLPVERLWSPDERWAYTLYAVPGGHPFVHALDTAGRTAACIDLEMLGDGEAKELALDAAGNQLTVNDRDGDAVALIDTASFEVSEPPATAAAPEPDDAGVPLWALVPAGIAAVALLAWLALPRRPGGVRGASALR